MTFYILASYYIQLRMWVSFSFKDVEYSIIKYKTPPKLSDHIQNIHIDFTYFFTFFIDQYVWKLGVYSMIYVLSISP